MIRMFLMVIGNNGIDMEDKTLSICFDGNDVSMMLPN